MKTCLLAAPVLAVVSIAVGCSSSSSGSGGSSGECGAYVQLLANCNLLDPSQLSTDKARYEQICDQVLALPGVTVTAAYLQACGAAIESGGCNAPAQTPACSEPAGTLAAGASCVADEQCQSGSCTQTGSSSCGTCDTPLQAGQACDSGVGTPGGGSTPSGYCVPGTQCGPAGTCVAIAFVGSGATCNGGTSVCSLGLYCGEAGTCTAQLGQGAVCTGDLSCLPPLVCPGVSPTTTCQPPGAAGASCDGDSDCAPALACANGTCGAVTWVQPGQPCDDALERCSIGSCPQSAGVGSPTTTCPAVVQDGQACGGESTTCEFSSNCIVTETAEAGTGGTCVLGFPSCM